MEEIIAQIEAAALKAKTDLAEYSVLQKAAADAIAARDAGRAALVGFLNDTIASLTQIRDSIEPPVAQS